MNQILALAGLHWGNSSHINQHRTTRILRKELTHLVEDLPRGLNYKRCMLYLSHHLQELLDAQLDCSIAQRAMYLQVKHNLQRLLVHNTQ